MAVTAVLLRRVRHLLMVDPAVGNAISLGTNIDVTPMKITRHHFAP